MIGLKVEDGIQSLHCKPTHEVIFSRKTKCFLPTQEVHYPPITFNNVPSKHVQSHKHLGLSLDAKLDFH